MSFSLGEPSKRMSVTSMRMGIANRAIQPIFMSSGYFVSNLMARAMIFSRYCFVCMSASSTGRKRNHWAPLGTDSEANSSVWESFASKSVFTL